MGESIYLHLARRGGFVVRVEGGCSAALCVVVVIGFLLEWNIPALPLVSVAVT